MWLGSGDLYIRTTCGGVNLRVWMAGGDVDPSWSHPQWHTRRNDIQTNREGGNREDGNQSRSTLRESPRESRRTREAKTDGFFSFAKSYISAVFYIFISVFSW